MAMEETKRAEDALRRLGELRDRIRELVAYEVSTYRSIVDAGLQDAVKGICSRNVLEKFSKLTEADLNRVCAVCIENGYSIRAYFESTRKDEQRMAMLDKAQGELNQAVKEYKKMGCVTLPSPSSAESKSVSLSAAIEGLRKVTRDRLLKAGAVGVGDGRYVDPETHQREVWDALVIRAEQIRHDMLGCARLYAALESKPGDAERGLLDKHAWRGFSIACEALAGDALG